MTMDHPPKISPAGPEPAAQSPEASRLDDLIGAALKEQANRAIPAPDALARLNARLDAATPAPKRRIFRPRLVAAFAAALVVILIVSPVGRLAAAGVTNATQAIITTVREITTGGSDNPTPRTGSPGAPSRASGSATTSLSTKSVGSPDARGTIASGSPTSVGTATGTTIAGTVTPPAAGTTVPTGTPANTTPRASQGNAGTNAVPPATPAPSASVQAGTAVAIPATSTASAVATAPLLPRNEPTAAVFPTATRAP